LFPRPGGEDLARQSRSFAPEQKRIARAKPHFVMSLAAACLHGEDARAVECPEAGLETLVRVHPRHLVLVESGTLHARIVKPEPERPHEVKCRAGIGAEPDDVAGV